MMRGVSPYFMSVLKVLTRGVFTQNWIPVIMNLTIELPCHQIDGFVHSDGGG